MRSLDDWMFCVGLRIAFYKLTREQVSIIMSDFPVSWVIETEYIRNLLLLPLSGDTLISR